MTILFLLRCYPFYFHYSSFRGHFLDLLEDTSELNGLVTESARLARLVDAPLGPDLNPCKRVGPQVERPGVGVFKAGVDIAQHEPSSIPDVVDGGRVLLPRAAPRGRKPQERAEGSAERNPPSCCALIEPTVKGGNHVFDDPHPETGRSKSPQEDGPGTTAFVSCFFVPSGGSFHSNSPVSLSFGQPFIGKHTIAHP